MLSLSQLLADSLLELDLTSCVNVTDLSVCAIATYLRRLQVLRLGWCKEVSDWGLLGVAQESRSEPHDGTVRPRLQPHSSSCSSSSSLRL